MKKYDKDVIEKRFRERRRARKRDSAKGVDRAIELFLLVFAIGAVIVAALVFMTLY